MPIAEFPTLAAAEKVWNSLSEDGAVILRAAITTELLGRLQLYCKAAFAIMDIKSNELDEGRSPASDHLRPYVETYKGLQYVADDVLSTILSNAGLANPGLSAIGEPLLKSLQPFFPVSLDFVPNKSVLRRQGVRDDAQKTAYVVWHRDAHAVQTVELGDVFNCWVPCEQVGIDRASLQVVIGSNRIMKRRPVNYSSYDNPQDEEVHYEYGSERICTAFLNPGDALIFSDHTIHRTQPMSDDALTRMSGEFRFRIRN